MTYSCFHKAPYSLEWLEAQATASCKIMKYLEQKACSPTLSDNPREIKCKKIKALPLSRFKVFDRSIVHDTA